MAQQFVVQEAKRELIWVKLDLMAPSGGGKSFSALRIASGMQQELEKMGEKTKILMGNTEGARGRYYAKEFKYDIVDIAQDADPETYAAFINWAVEQGYKILILDSASHEWKRALAIHQQNGGDFKAFAKVTPRHEKFTSTIANSPIHIIVTARGEDKYEMEKNDAGKTTVKKLGVGAEQRKDFEYEFTATLLIDQKSNLAEVQKDNTHLFENRGQFLLTEQDGIDLIKWANSGEGYTEPVRATETFEASPAKVEKKKEATLLDQVMSLAKEKLALNKDATKSAIKKYTATGNPVKIESEKDLKKLLKDLGKIVVEDEVKPETNNEQA